MTHELYNRMTLRDWEKVQAHRDALRDKKVELRALQKEVRSMAQKVNTMLDEFGANLKQRLK